MSGSWQRGKIRRRNGRPCWISPKVMSDWRSNPTCLPRRRVNDNPTDRRRPHVAGLLFQRGCLELCHRYGESRLFARRRPRYARMLRLALADGGTEPNDVCTVGGCSGGAPLTALRNYTGLVTGNFGQRSTSSQRLYGIPAAGVLGGAATPHRIVAGLLSGSNPWGFGITALGGLLGLP